MIKIEKLWFESGRIWILTSDERTYSRPLEAFPILKEASDAQRAAYKIGRFGDDVRWEEIDEDIHISSFYENLEPDYNNEVALLFKRFPQLNIAEVAKSIGISSVLLFKYIYGMKKPGEEIMLKIKEALHLLGEELVAV